MFVDGCFWHACPEHGRRQPWAGPNARLWEQKLARTVARDANATTQALAAGWTVVRIWECAVTANVAAVAEQVLAPLPAGEAVVIGPTAPGA